MKHLGKWITTLVVALALLLPMIPAQAVVNANFTDVNASITCSYTSVEFSLAPPALGKDRDFTVVLGLTIDHVLVDTTRFTVPEGSTGTYTFTYAPLTPTTHTIHVLGSATFVDPSSEANPAIEILVSAVIDCTLPDEVPTDGRFCFAPGQAPAALYSYTDGAGKTGLKVYAITGSEGTEVINLDSAELEAIPGLPEAATLIAEGSPYNIALYKLPSGAFQINVDDARAVKTHVCEFRGIPAFSTKVYTIE